MQGYIKIAAASAFLSAALVTAYGASSHEKAPETVVDSVVAATPLQVSPCARASWPNIPRECMATVDGTTRVIRNVETQPLIAAKAQVVRF